MIHTARSRPPSTNSIQDNDTQAVGTAERRSFHGKLPHSADLIMSDLHGTMSVC